MNFDIVSFIPRAVMQGIPLLYGSTLHDRAGDEGYNIKIHFLTPPSFRMNGTGPCS